MILFTFGNHVNRHILRIIYFDIFDAHIYYANLTWGQNVNAINRIVILKMKDLRIMYFQSRETHSSPLFKSSHILKLKHKILAKV